MLFSLKNLTTCFFRLNFKYNPYPSMFNIFPFDQMVQQPRMSSKRKLNKQLDLLPGRVFE